MQIRKTIFDIGSTATGYGLTVAQVADAITVARGKLSASAGNNNTAEQGLTTTASVSCLSRCYALMLLH